MSNSINIVCNTHNAFRLKVLRDCMWIQNSARFFDFTVVSQFVTCQLHTKKTDIYFKRKIENRGLKEVVSR